MDSGARRLLAELFRAALKGVDPAAGVAGALRDARVSRALRRAREVGVFAVGKAADGMLRGAGACHGRGLVILPRGYRRPVATGVETLFSVHPEPDRSSLAAARRAVAFFRSFGPEDAILCLVSGGASSLLALPRPGVTLTQKRRAVARLSARGASILELNRLRTRLSAVKGGRLGRATRARLVTLVLSDVPGDLPRAVGSGPTVRNRRGDVVRVVGSNGAGLEAVAEEARRRGFSPRFAPRRLSGEARLAGAAFGRAAAKLAPGEALIAGGETTVSISRRTGRGGRNLELALGASLAVRGLPGIELLAAGSDGRDGSSSAAGAFGDGGTFDRARRRGLDADAALSRHDSHHFFAALGDLFVTGSTGTNVADWAFALRTSTNV
jgi:glycerate 2-kinase